MDSGAALRASAISALRSIKYWAAGAMVGYGFLASFAGACPNAAQTTLRAKSKHAITLNPFRFIRFSYVSPKTTVVAERIQESGGRLRRAPHLFRPPRRA